MDYLFKKAFIVTLVSLALATMPTNGQERVTGPDGRLQVSVNVEKAFFTVDYDGNPMLLDSPLGLMADMGAMPTLQGVPQGRAAGVGDFTHDLVLKEVKRRVIDQNYTLDRSKVENVHYVANELVLSIENARRQPMDIVFRVSDNDIALRYELPKNGQRGSCRILYESTGFRFPEQTTTFITPQSDAMIGWQRSKPSYEEEYSNDGPMDVPSQYGHGYTFPALFHVGDNGWVLLSETGVSSQYCGSRLGDFTDGVYKIEYPMPEENNGNGTVAPALRLPGATPWRTITVGSTLEPIVETTAPWDNVEPLYEPLSDYRYGRSTWSWIVWQDASCNWDDQVLFIDLASEMGYEYILIDAGWDVNIGYDRMEDLIRYADSKDVDVFLWYSSSGYWNDIVQSPVNRMDNSIVRKREMDWLEKVGVKGVKIDFWGGDKQETMRLYEDVLSDANDHNLMVIFHGCTIPRGWERMYPNYVGSEAVLASENLVFGQNHCDNEAFKATLHPFIRNAIGCMEFGGCFMNHRYNRGNDGGTTRRTTDVFQLATTVLFQNPIQNIAITPNNLTDAPAICMDFLKDVPTTWQETRFIDGYPGKYVVLARRSGDNWYLAAVNATDQTLKLKLDLSFMQDGAVNLYTDGKDLQPVLTHPKNKGAKLFQIEVKPLGGTIVTGQ